MRAVLPLRGFRDTLLFGEATRGRSFVVHTCYASSMPRKPQHASCIVRDRFEPMALGTRTKYLHRP